MTSLDRDEMEYIFGMLALECKRIADEHGFTDATAGEDIALMHSELSEALEDVRNVKWEMVLDEKGKPTGVPSELADTVIRIFHFCGKHNIDLAAAVNAKMKYNESRPYKHGGKVL